MFALILLLAAACGSASERPAVAFLKGTLERGRPSGREWDFVRAGDTVEAGARYRTAQSSIAGFTLAGGTRLYLKENTLVEVSPSALDTAAPAPEVTLYEGEIFFSAAAPPPGSNAPMRRRRIVTRALVAELKSEAACFVYAGQRPPFTRLSGVKGTVEARALSPAATFWVPEARALTVELDRRAEPPARVDSAGWAGFRWLNSANPELLARERERGRQLRETLRAVASDTLR